MLELAGDSGYFHLLCFAGSKANGSQLTDSFVFIVLSYYWQGNDETRNKLPPLPPLDTRLKVGAEETGEEGVILALNSTS